MEEATLEKQDIDKKEEEQPQEKKDKPKRVLSDAPIQMIDTTVNNQK